MAGEPPSPEPPGTETVSEEQVSRSTDLPTRIAVDKRATEFAESDSHAKKTKGDVSELVNDLMHLGAAVGLRFRVRCPNWKIGKCSKSHGDVTTDPEHRDACDPDHPDERSKWKLRKK